MQFEPSNSSLHFLALPLGTNTSHSYLLSSTPAATNSSLNNFTDARVGHLIPLTKHEVQSSKLRLHLGSEKHALGRKDKHHLPNGIAS
jgi:hypothetical protein